MRIRMHARNGIDTTQAIPLQFDVAPTEPVQVGFKDHSLQCTAVFVGVLLLYIVQAYILQDSGLWCGITS